MTCSFCIVTLYGVRCIVRDSSVKLHCWFHSMVVLTSELGSTGFGTCSYQYVEIKCQLDTTEVFIADLIACSTCFGHHYAHHQDLKSIIQWLLLVVFRAVVFKLLVWCGTEGYVSGLQDACWFTVEQAIRSAIRTSVASSWHFISTH